jgi:hypothetical protein
MRRVFAERGCRERRDGSGADMAIPTVVRDDALRHVALFCENQIPEHARDEIRLEHAVRGSKITIVERRPPWSELIGPDWTSMSIAQLRYDEHTRTWSLYAADRNDRWFLYDNIGPTSDVGPLLAEIADDPTCIFWG